MKRFLAIILTLIMAVSAMGMTTVFAEENIVEITEATYRANGGFDFDFTTTPDKNSEIVITVNVLNNYPVKLDIYKNDKVVVFEQWIDGQGEYQYKCKNSESDMSKFYLDFSDAYQLGYEVHCSIKADKLYTDTLTAPNTNPFSDIGYHWAKQSIVSIADKGIISGYPDGTFKPDAPVTRAEFAKIASVAFNLEDKVPLSNYNDLDSNAWYYPYVEKAAPYIPKYKLPVDYPCMQPYENNANGGFLPNSEAIRMHIAEAMVNIYKGYVDVDIPDIYTIQKELLATFNDADYEELFVMHNGIPASNAERMFVNTWLANKLGIMQGDDNGYFNPYGYVTRAELVTMIDRMLNSSEQPDLSDATADVQKPNIELWNKDGYITSYNHWYKVDDTTTALIEFDDEVPELIRANYIDENGNEELIGYLEKPEQKSFSMELDFETWTKAGQLYFQFYWGYGRPDLTTDTYFVAGDDNFDKNKELTNAENLSVEDMWNLQYVVDNGHRPLRLNPENVIRECMRDLGYDSGNGTITNLTDGTIITAVYTTEGFDSYKIELFRPIRQNKTGALVVRSVTYIAKTS